EWSLFVWKKLLDDDVRASFFELLLGILGGILAHAGEDLGASGLSHRLGFAETEAGQLTDDLDDVDLLGARILDDHIELGLLFNGFSSGGSATTDGGHSHRSSGGNAPLLFEHLHEVSSLENGQGGKFFHEFSELFGHCLALLD